jgi:hypothetical protein
MKRLQKIGFDLDGIFIGPPLFVPKTIVEHIYKKSNKNLSYRIPGEFEKKIRILSHYYLLRPPIKRNIKALMGLSKTENLSIFLISSRFSFLKSRTETWLKLRSITDLFKKMYFNYDNEQPHIFKDRIIKLEKIDKFVDDDLDLLIYLATNNPNVDFFWIGNDKNLMVFPSNLKRIKNIDEFKEYL